MIGLDLLGAHGYPAHPADTYVRKLGGRAYSGEMARSRLHSIRDLAETLGEVVQSGDEIPAWCSDFIAVAHDKLASVHGYLEPLAAAGGDR